MSLKILKNGVLIDGTGRDPIHNASVLIQNNIIKAAGTEDEIQAPKDAEIIDVDGKTIMPGMMDLHIHVMEGGGANEGDLAYRAAHLLKQSLDNGITTIRSLGEPVNSAFSMKRAQHRGWFIGSRVRVCGTLIAPTGGYYATEVHGPWELRKKVREFINSGADHIKISTTSRPWHMLDGYTMEELSALVDESHKYGKKVACHAGMMPGLINAIKAGVNTIEAGPSQLPFEVDNETIKLMVESDVWWTPTLFSFHKERTPEAQRAWEEHFKRGRYARAPWDAEPTNQYFLDQKKYSEINFKKCLAGGVKNIITGSDMGPTPDMATVHDPLNTFGKAHEEAILFVKFGMPPMDAIKAATLNGAIAYGEDDKLGSIEPGKLADIIVVDGDPLKDITALRKVVLVMLDGTIHKRL